MRYNALKLSGKGMDVVDTYYNLMDGDDRIGLGAWERQAYSFTI